LNALTRVSVLAYAKERCRSVTPSDDSRYTWVSAAQLTGEETAMLEKLPESVGHALEGQRAGIENTAFRKLLAVREFPRLRVRSTAFENMDRIPVQYTADGAGISPPLEWDNVPPAATRVVLIVEDADSPTLQPMVHAIAVVGGENTSLAVGALPSPDRAGSDVSTGLNSFLQHAWLPPDPPPGHGEHRYAFQVFALDAGAELSAGPGRGELVDAVLGNAVAAGCVVGVYGRDGTVKIDSESRQAELPLDILAPA
jgi:Raf kinase inhibitor-like YbhB/YbcL family protein